MGKKYPYYGKSMSTMYEFSLYCGFCYIFRAMAGPFRRFSIRVWQNARKNTVRRAKVLRFVFLFLRFYNFNPLSANPEKWPNTLKQIVGNLPAICLSVFDHFMNLALKGLIKGLCAYT